MIEKKELGILLFTKLSSENNLFLKILTENDEILTGLSFGGSTKKKRGIFQIGYLLNFIIKNKNNSLPNNISAELSKPYFHNIFNDKYKLHCLLAITSILNVSIIEGQKIKGLFTISRKIIEILSIEDKWLVDFYLYLLNLLKLIGYEIDFTNNFSKNYFNLKTLQFEEKERSASVIFPHNLLIKKEIINSKNANSFFKIFEHILQNHHLNNMNLNIPTNYLKFKKLILEFLFNNEKHN